MEHNIPASACQNRTAEYRGLYDKNGVPIDTEGNAIGWAERDGHMYIINGNLLQVKSLLIEIIIPSAATPVANYPFADQPLLRNTSLWGLKFYTSTVVPISPISKNPLVSDLMLGYMFLWMQQYANSYNFFQNKPCVDFRANSTTVVAPGTTAAGLATPTYINGANQQEGLIGQHVNWPNGYIIFSDSTKITASTAFSILMEIRYSLYNNWMMDGQGSTFGLR